MSRRITTVLALALLTACAAHADAQTLGTFRWQLQPFCNIVTVTVTQNGGIYGLEGTDDGCGGGQDQASVIGTAFPNPDGSIGFGLNIVSTPDGQPVPVNADIALATLNGSWRDGGGNSGAFVITPGAGTGGSPRPAPARVMGVNARAEGVASSAIGRDTHATGEASTAMGLSTLASGFGSTATGVGSQATGTAAFAGGSNAVAAGSSSFAFGNAEANRQGSFVFGDQSSSTRIVSDTGNQFLVRAVGGVWFYGGAVQYCGMPAASGHFICTGVIQASSFTATSDRHRKQDVAPLDGEVVLRKISGMPVTTWSFIDAPGVRHAGPMAQDFRAAFGLGENDTTIGYTDINGINMRAIQALESRTRDLRDENAVLRERLARLEQLLLEKK